MPNYAILRTEKIKSMSDLAHAVKHNNRERVPINADPNIAQNGRILTFIDGDPINDPIYKNKTRKGAVLAVEWVLTASDLSNINLRDWARDNIIFACDKMGGIDNILRADLHMDETTPHLHILFKPVYQGKLNCKHYLGGNKYVLRDLQDEYAKSMSKYGLERGISKEITKAWHNKSSFRQLKIEYDNLMSKYSELENRFSDLLEDVKKFDEIKSVLEKEKQKQPLSKKLYNIFKLDNLSDIKNELENLKTDHEYFYNKTVKRFFYSVLDNEKENDDKKLKKIKDNLITWHKILLSEENENFEEEIFENKNKITLK